MDILEIIKDWISGDQQEKAFIDYDYFSIETGRHVSIKDFKEWYKVWCINNKLLPDFSKNQLEL